MTVMDLDLAGVAAHKRQKGPIQGPGTVEQQEEYEGEDLSARSDGPSPRRQKASTGMSVIERLLMGKLTEADLRARGIQLSEQELQLYQRIKYGYQR